MGTGKKVAFWGCLGCGGVTLLIFLVVGVGIGYIAFEGYNFGKAVGETYKVMIDDYQALEQEFTFTPPQDGLIDPERLEAYLAVRDQMDNYAREYGKKLGSIGDEIGSKFDEGGISSFFGGFSKIKDIVQFAATMGAELGHQHVSLLRESEMAIDEYQWQTQTMLGTIMKAAEQEKEEATLFWEEYLTHFEDARKEQGNFKVNTGNFNMDSKDMNEKNLFLALEDIQYKEDNWQKILPALDLVTISAPATMVDFLTLHFDDIMKQMQEQTK